jgi:hypothetical protein
MKLVCDRYAQDARHTPEPRVPEFAMRSDTCLEPAENAGRCPFCGTAETLLDDAGTVPTFVFSGVTIVDMSKSFNSMVSRTEISGRSRDGWIQGEAAFGDSE